jgi:hypothetical protein
MAQAVTRWPLIAETRARSRTSPFGFVVDEVTLAQGFLRVFTFSLVSIITTLPDTDLYLHVYLTRRTNGRSLGTFQKIMFFRSSGSSG